MYHMKSNFYPTDEPKNGYIGKADIVIANAIRINNISVFQKDDGYSIDFSDYGTEGNSYVVPKSKEAYAAMLGVVSKAVEADGHYAFENGEYGPKFAVSGTKVSEKYADGRYTVQIGDLCSLNGITTRQVNLADKRSFISVDMPAIKGADGKVRMYKNSEGKEVASLEFEGLVSKWTDKEGKEQSLNYGIKLADAVKKERLNLYPERKAPFKQQVNDAEAQKTPSGTSNNATQKEQIDPTL